MTGLGPAAESAYSIEVRDASELGPRDAASAQRLLRELIGETAVTRWSDEFWSWKHTASPFGPSLVALARSRNTGEVVTVQHAMRWRLVEPGGSRRRAARHCDGATDPGHQRRGLYTATDHALQDRLRGEGTADLLGTPNPKTLGMELKTGWRIACRPRSLFRPILSPASLAALLSSGPSDLPVPDDGSAPKVGLSWHDLLHRFGNQVEAVVAGNESSRIRVGARTPRGLEYVAWRYGTCPTAHYSFVPWSVRDGSLDGLAVVRSVGQTRRAGRARPTLLPEAFVRSPSTPAYRRLFREVLRATGHGYLSAHFAPGSLEHRALRRSGFLPLPGRRSVFTTRTLGDEPAPHEALDLTLGELEVL